MELLTQLQAHFGDTYRLERELGGGGMARVFVATEVALQRRVVIKILGREMAEGLSVERFTREIALAARLQDPHIVPLYSAGTTAEGLPWFTMPFIAGESLRARLQAGPVAIDEALRILRDVAEALEYAHARGVVHRDIKPENVLLSGRNAVVADFGIAKAITAARTLSPEHSSGTLTTVGMSLGTPAYMAPEQAAGDPATDHRADLYAWGLMAYELLAVAHPFAHRSGVQQLIAAQLAEAPKPLDAVRPELPPALVALVMQCLAKLPDERPADATSILARLAVDGGDNVGSSRSSIVPAPAPAPAPRARRSRTLALVTLVALLAVVGAFVVWRGRASPARADATPSIAVLPFENQGDTATAYVTEGITDEIRGKLMGVRDLVVIARASSNQYRATKKSPKEIAKELGVRWLLTGTVRVLGSGGERRVLVRPELVEVTADGRSQGRWGQPFDVQGADIVGLQGEIGEKVVSAMEVAIGGDDRRQLVEVPTRDPQAYDLFLRARAATDFGADRSAPALTAAQALLEEAVSRDSTYARAWGELTLARADLYDRWTPSPALADATRQAAERAKALDPTGVWGEKAQSFYLRSILHDGRAAAAAQERAYRAAPGEAATTNNLAIARTTQGRLDEALELYTRASRLDPRNVTPLRNLGGILRRMGRLAEARALTARVQAIAPTSPGTLRDRVDDELYAGDSVSARRILNEGLHAGAPERLLPEIVSSPSLGPLLDPGVVQAQLSRGPVSVGGDRANWAIVQSSYAWLRGDSVAVRAWGDTARRLFERHVRDLPNDDGMRLFYGYALAQSGRREDALREARNSLEMVLKQGFDRRSPEYSTRLYEASLVAVQAGAYSAALDWLEEQHSLPLHFSPGRLATHQFFAPLRADPRFQRLMAVGAR